MPARSAVVLAVCYVARVKTGSNRAFMRREDYQPKTTATDSPFRHFVVHCLKCGSFKLKVRGEYDEEAGELALIFLCPRCRTSERISAE